MSNQRKVKANLNREVAQTLTLLTGGRIAGGCDDCTAFQTVEHSAGIIRVTVHHDDGCPFLSGITR